MPSPLQLFPQGSVVVDFTVEDNPERFVLVGHGLMAAGEVDDSQSSHPDTDFRTDPYPRVVWPAVDECVEHAFQHTPIHPSDNTGNAAHG
jgi:hypothetical protein